MGISLSGIGTVGKEQLISSCSNGEPNWSYIPTVPIPDNDIPINSTPCRLIFRSFWLIKLTPLQALSS